MNACNYDCIKSFSDWLTATYIAGTGYMWLVRVFLPGRSPPLGLALRREDRRMG